MSELLKRKYRSGIPVIGFLSVAFQSPAACKLSADRDPHQNQQNSCEKKNNKEKTIKRLLLLAHHKPTQGLLFQTKKTVITIDMKMT